MSKPVSKGCFGCAITLNLCGVLLAPFLAYGIVMSAFSPNSHVKSDIAFWTVVGWIWNPFAMVALRCEAVFPLVLLFAALWALLVGYVAGRIGASSANRQPHA